ncbi:protein O-mannosyl-transferase 2-like [Eriocheir sinensis]|uniref:protein O-mannosyl-transferase 2-like n=1 Tax=Eriocheir sinensis TaxID=95602 RepID=UPI0021CAE082|nr:protein O-mannosyl-transferase 2-like [Eriocheir sinensis]
MDEQKGRKEGEEVEEKEEVGEKEKEGEVVAGSTTTTSQEGGGGKADEGRRLWWGCLLALTFLALTTRQVSLHDPGICLWDEVHFGTFANHYLNRTFYHDVHPPLGKMMIAGVGWLAGYDGSFEFKVGKKYPENVNFVAMRSMMAMFGASLVPLTFLIVWEVSASLPAATLAAVCVLCDTFLHRLNTLILLDPLLLAALLAAVYGAFKFHSQRHREWSRAWWAWLAFTAVFLGVVMSVKYVGVFTVATVGLNNAHQIAALALNPRRPLWVVVPHVVARLVVFAGVSSLVYLSSFVLHFLILTKAAKNGGGFYHTEFYAAFDGNEYDNTSFPHHVHYGANITLQNSRPLCGYLESWYDLFPSTMTAPCQQVTASYVRDDELLMWTIKKVNLTAGSVLDGSDAREPPVLVRSGDHVMLTHAATGRSLRSHGHRAAITRRQLQVCGYGDDGAGGPFETWQLLVVGEPLGAPLRVIDQDFMLLHYKMQCYLRANERVKLPEEWAFHGAKEVTCAKKKDETGLRWHVNWNASPKLREEVSARALSVGMWGKILHQHHNMFIGNAVLTGNGDDEERHARPWMWPVLWQVQTMGTQVMNRTTGEEHFAVGMTNPFVTYLNLACLGGAPLLALAHAFYGKRRPHQPPADVAARRGVVVSCAWLGLCWAIHYLPFFFMSRVLYYHHYCPAYLFSCMITGVLLAYGCKSLSRKFTRGKGGRKGGGRRQELVYRGLLGLCGASIVTSYLIFFPLATYVSGIQFEPNARLNPFLDKLHVGQLWPEFGYRMEEYVTVTSTMVEKLNASNYANPDVNATLYFAMQLNATAEEHPVISPVAASSFALWRPQVAL